MSKVACGLLTLALSGASCLQGDGYLVEGIVVDAQSHVPLANMRVSLASINARDQKMERVTKQNGQFSLPVSQPGKYQLKATKIGYPPQDYKQAPLSGFSSAIVVRGDQDTRHIVFEAKRGGSIAGQIRDEDAEPVGYALVALFQSAILNGERKVVSRGQMRANALGEFRFRSLQPGAYFVGATGRPWFADSLIRLNQRSEPPAFPRTFRAVKPGAVVPQPEVEVQADASDEQPEKPEEPEAPPPPFSADPAFHGTAFMTTFYPNAKTVEAASLVRVEAGSETQVPIVLPTTTAVSLKGTISIQGEVGGGHILLHKKIYDKYMSFQDTWVGADGAFQFTNVPSGLYEIVANSQSSSGPSSWHIRQEVEVGSVDTEIQLRPPQLGSLSGRVLFEGDPPSSSTGLFVSLRNEQGQTVGTEVSPDGSFSWRRLAAGRYEVSAGSRQYIAAYLKGPAGERLPLSIEITPGASVRNELVLTSAVAVIEGTVEQAGALHIGAFVLLLPKDQASRWAYRFDQTDSDGSFSLAAIPEGDYFLIALTTSEDVAFRDFQVAARLTKSAKLIHVEAGKTLDLKVDLVDVKTLNLPVL